MTNFIGRDYYLCLNRGEKIDDNIKEKEKNASNGTFESSDAINDGVAEFIYEAFQSLSHINTSTYGLVLNLLWGMTYKPPLTDLMEGYRDLFEKKLWEQIKHNVVDRYYPDVLKIYLQFIGCSLVLDTQDSGWIGEQTEKMRRLLYVDLKPKFDSGMGMVNGEKMQDKLLPKSMEYKNNNFIYKLDDGKGREKIINQPAEGSLPVFDTLEEVTSEPN